MPFDNAISPAFITMAGLMGEMAVARQALKHAEALRQALQALEAAVAASPVPLVGADGGADTVEQADLLDDINFTLEPSFPVLRRLEVARAVLVQLAGLSAEHQSQLPA